MFDNFKRMEDLMKRSFGMLDDFERMQKIEQMHRMFDTWKMPNALESLEQMNKMYSQFENQAWLSAENKFGMNETLLKSLDSLTGQFGDVGLRIGRDLEAMMKQPFAGLSDSLEAVARANAMSLGWREANAKALGQSADQFTEITNKLLEQNALFSVAANLSKEWRNLGLISDSLDQLAYPQYLFAEIPYPSTDEEYDESYAEEVLEFLQNLLLPLRDARKRFTISEFINLLAILSFVLTIYQIYDSKITTKRLLETIGRENQETRKQIELSKNEILEAIKKSDAASEASTSKWLFVSSQYATIQSAPRKRSRIATRLPAGQPVRFLQRHKRFVEVEYYDLLKKTTETGWVLKKHLREAK